MRQRAALVAVTLLAGCSAEGATETSGDGSTSSEQPTTLGTLGMSTGGTFDPADDDDDDDDDDADSTGGSEGDGALPDLPPPPETECDELEALIAALDDTDDPAVLVDAFVQTIAYGGDGFPIVDGNTLCIATMDEVGVPMSVAGDFNDWEAGEYPLEFAMEGFALRYAMIELPEPPAGLYKLARSRPDDDPEFSADPWARRFGWDEFGEYSRFDVDPALSHYERWPAFREEVGDLAARDVVVYVPAGALDEESLPTMYMHDGQNLFSPNAFFGGWQVGDTADEAIEDGDIRPMLVVGVYNTPARFEEYTHVTEFFGRDLVGGQADEYADFLVAGIKSFMDERYPTSPLREDTAVLGSSLGGLVSLYIGWRYPEVFGYVGSMSGTVDWGAFAGNPTVAELYVEDAPADLRLYIDSGGSAGTGCPGGSQDNYCENLVLVDTLTSLGWEEGDDLLYRHQPDAPHNEAAWASRLPDMLRDWFPGAP